MYTIQPPLEPRFDLWNDRNKPKFIERKIEEICASIARKGQESQFPDVFDYLYEYIEDNIEKFLEE